MSNIRKTIIGLFALISFKVQAQNEKLFFKGNLVDSLKNPIFSANLSLLNPIDSTLIMSTSSDQSGEFLLKDLISKNYILKISHVSYETKWVNLKIDENNNLENQKFVLNHISNLLDEVEIINKNKIFVKQSDRTIINVKESVLYTNQIDLFEMLRKLPGIWIDRNNNILFNGQQKVLVTINNKTQYLSNEDLIQRIKSIPTNTIDKIEIIDNPGAKYSAQGFVVLNINTSFKIRHGLNMSLNSLVGSSVGNSHLYPKTRNGLSFSSGGDKLNISVNYNFIYNESLRKICEKIDFNNSFLNQSLDVRNQPDRNHSLNVGVDYEFNKKNSLNVFYSFSDMIEKVRQNNLISFLEQSNNIINTKSSANEKLTSNQNALSFNYRFKIDQKSKIEYSSDQIWANKRQNSNYINKKEVNSIELLNNYTVSDVFVFVNQLDYSNILNKGSSIKSGLKFSDIDTDNNIDFRNLENSLYINNFNKSNKFKYNEKIYAGYFELNYKWDKFEILLGMRYEKSNIYGKSHINNFSFNHSIDDIFPNASLGYTISDSWDVSILYNRKINRPNYKDINPFIYYLNPYTQLEGNPELLPSITNKIQTNLNYKKLYTLKFTFYKTNDVFTTAQFQNINTGEQKLIPTNIGDLINYDINIWIPINYKSLWEGYFDITLMYQKYIENKQINLGFKSIQQTTIQLYNQNTIKLGKNYSIDLTNTFLSPSLNGQFRFTTIYEASIGLKKTLLDNRLECNLVLNDVFKTFKMKGRLVGPGWISNYSDYSDSQQISLTLKFDLIKRGKVYDKNPKWVSDEEKNRL